MAEELGKIVKPPAEDFRMGRKLFFVPLLFGGKDSPADYLERLGRYWTQVEEQVANLELKLGPVKRVYHEMIASAGDEGLKALKDLNEQGHQITLRRTEKGARLEALENADLLTEFMDWSRCLSIGLQNQRVLARVFEAYTEAGKKRIEFIGKHIDETLEPEEAGLLFMREGHHVQFPSGVQVFYVSPPALDEVNRWLRDQEAQHFREESGNEAEAEQA